MGQEADPLIPIDFADRIGRRRRKQNKHPPSLALGDYPRGFKLWFIDLGELLLLQTKYQTWAALANSERSQAAK